MEAEAVPPLGLPPLPPFGGTATERALEEAAATGRLSLAGRRLRYFPDSAAQRWDLSDTTQADLSRNRFAALPPVLLGLQCLELLSLAQNCLRSVPAHIANLSALTYLNVSRNQLRSLPPSLCRLQLHVLLLSHNRLQRLPEGIGGMAALKQLDVSCNELRSLPPSMGRLSSLRDLNVRRNRITALPAELSLLPLVRLDFSCNHVTAIPCCFSRLRLLQALLCDHNPLQAPPPHVCLKGRVHIFKYLQSEPPDAAPPDAFTPCLPTELCPLRPRGGLDSGFNSVDSGSKRWSGNEFSDLTHGPKEKRSPVGGDSDPEQLELLEGSTTGGEEEEDPPRTPPQPPGGSPVSVRWGGDRRKRPPRSLQLWREREKGWRGEKRSSSDPMEPSTFLQHQTPRAPPRAPPPAVLSAHHEPPHPHEAPRPNSFLFRMNSTKAPPGGEGTELMAEVQQSTEALLLEKGGGASLCPPCRTPGTADATANRPRPPRTWPRPSRGEASSQRASLLAPPPSTRTPPFSGVAANQRSSLLTTSPVYRTTAVAPQAVHTRPPASHPPAFRPHPTSAPAWDHRHQPLHGATSALRTRGSAPFFPSGSMRMRDTTRLYSAGASSLHQ